RDQAIIQVWLNDQSSSQINTDKRLSSTVFCHLYFSSMTKIRRDNFKITTTSLFSATYFELIYSCVITQRDEPFGLFSIGNYFTTASTSLSMACMPPRLSLIKYQVLESRKTIWPFWAALVCLTRLLSSTLRAPPSPSVIAALRSITNR